MMGGSALLRRGMVLGGLAMLAGCAAPGDMVVERTPQRLPRPNRVNVALFTPLAATYDPVQRAVSGVPRPVEREPAGPAELRAARAAQVALREAILLRLRERGWPAEAGGAEQAEAHTLLVQGQIVALVEAGRSGRPVPAFGSARLAAKADVQLLYVPGIAAPRYLESFEVETASRSGLASAAEMRRLADLIVARVEAAATAQGWDRLARS